MWGTRKNTTNNCELDGTNFGIFGAFDVFLGLLNVELSQYNPCHMELSSSKPYTNRNHIFNNVGAFLERVRRKERL